MKTLLIVGLGSALGGILRYLLFKVTNNSESFFHVGTLLANIIGCFVLGLIVGFVDHGYGLSNNLKSFLVMGVCGGFTTFSTFINDSFGMLRNGDVLYSLLYILVSLTIGISFLAIGYWIPNMKL